MKKILDKELTCLYFFITSFAKSFFDSSSELRAPAISRLYSLYLFLHDLKHSSGTLRSKQGSFLISGQRIS